MMMMMTSIPNCILHFLQLVHAAFFSQNSFPCSITPPRTAAGLWAGEPRVTGWSQRLGKGQPWPQTCLCPFPVSRLMILLHRWILFPPLPSELALYQSHLAHLLLPTFLHPALAWLVPHGFCCHLWGSLSTISTLLVSPLLWQLLIHPCSAAGTISLFPRWGVSVSPGHNPCSLLLFTFSPVLDLLSLFPTARFVPRALRWDWQLFYQILSPLASLQELLPFFSGSITTAITSLMISWIFHLLEIGTCELSS